MRRTQWLDPVGTFWLASIGAAVGAILVISAYGWDAFSPGLITNFAASLAAFAIALEFERAREARRAEAEAATLRNDRERGARELEERLSTEARRRFEPVREELRRNRVSLEFLSGAFEPQPGVFNILHPELLEGAWQANAPRLTELIADYELMSNLAASYGRIEELRWRLRYRTTQLSTALDGMTKPLVDELLAEVTSLLERVAEQIANPDVQKLGLIHRGASELVLRVGSSSS